MGQLTMIKNNDFALLKPSEHNKCYKCGCYGLIERFYITEWCIMTGASSDDGIIYCETCLKGNGYE